MPLTQYHPTVGAVITFDVADISIQQSTATFGSSVAGKEFNLHLPATKERTLNKM
jgi:hypothetical protein